MVEAATEIMFFNVSIVYYFCPNLFASFIGKLYVFVQDKTN